MEICVSSDGWGFEIRRSVTHDLEVQVYNVYVLALLGLGDTGVVYDTSS